MTANYTIIMDARQTSFSLQDIIRAGQGFENNGYLVLPQDIVDKVVSEIERLEAVENSAVHLAMLAKSGDSKAANHIAEEILSSSPVKISITIAE